VQASAAPEAKVLGLPTDPLTVDERRQVVRQAQVLIEQLYVHLPLKRAMHAVDPVQRLRLLDRRLGGLSDRGFHDEMIGIFIGLRDLHTNYLLPQPYAGRFAVLPFRIEDYWENGARHYMVTGIAPAFPATPPFAVGVEVTHWNGTPIDRAVALNGELNGGSNADARHAQGLQSMTQRWMAMLAAPDEEWVTLSFRAGGGLHEQRFEWQVLTPTPSPTAAVPSAEEDPAASALGISALAEETRRAQKAVLVPEAMELESEMAAGAAKADSDLGKVSALPDVLQFGAVQGPNGDLGYLRIRTFMTNPGPFVEEVMRILDLLPKDGLIIDVRGNGGGAIMAGELLLQLFTPRRIEPESMCFINTRLTLQAAAKKEYEPWLQSIEESVEIGSPFSDALPLVPEYAELCNSVGQRYYSPVALVTDALCYSTTDIFSAGFQDHEIGPVIGTTEHTGAGGANVWDYKELQRVLPNDFKPLPKGASMRVAIRRSSRVGKRSGDPVEDLGVVADHVHQMTRRDLLERNADLIAAVGAILAELPQRGLDATVTEGPDGIEFALETKGLDRVDAYLDDRPCGSWDVTDGSQAQSISLDGTSPRLIELKGFLNSELAAARKLTL
jgi:hypothetical protein